MVKTSVFSSIFSLLLPPGNLVYHFLLSIKAKLSIKNGTAANEKNTSMVEWAPSGFRVEWSPRVWCPPPPPHHFLLEIYVTTSSWKFSLPFPPIYQSLNFNEKGYYCELSAKRQSNYSYQSPLYVYIEAKILYSS